MRENEHLRSKYKAPLDCHCNLNLSILRDQKWAVKSPHRSEKPGARCPAGQVQWLGDMDTGWPLGPLFYQWPLCISKSELVLNILWRNIYILLHLLPQSVAYTINITFLTNLVNLLDHHPWSLSLCRKGAIEIDIDKMSLYIEDPIISLTKYVKSRATGFLPNVLPIANK